MYVQIDNYKKENTEKILLILNLADITSFLSLYNRIHIVTFIKRTMFSINCADSLFTVIIYEYS